MDPIPFSANLPNATKLNVIVDRLEECIHGEAIAISEQNLVALQEVLPQKEALLEGLNTFGGHHPAVNLRWPELAERLRNAKLHQQTNADAMAQWVASTRGELEGIRRASTALGLFRQQLQPERPNGAFRLDARG